MSSSPFGCLRIGANGKLYCQGCELCAFTSMMCLSEVICWNDVLYVTFPRMYLKNASWSFCCPKRFYPKDTRNNSVVRWLARAFCQEMI